jgi:hypothetical protein
MLISSKKMDYWADVNKVNKKKISTAALSSKKDEVEMDPDEMNNDGGQTKGEHQQEIDSYYDWYISILNKRKTEDEGSSWEKGYMDAIVLSNASTASVATSKSNNSFYNEMENEQNGHHGTLVRDIPFEKSWNN